MNLSGLNGLNWTRRNKMDRIGLVRKKVDQIRPNKSEWIGVNRMD